MLQKRRASSACSHASPAPQPVKRSELKLRTAAAGRVRTGRPKKDHASTAVEGGAATCMSSGLIR